jgi:hypothetical protein
LTAPPPVRSERSPPPPPPRRRPDLRLRAPISRRRSATRWTPGAPCDLRSPRR